MWAKSEFVTFDFETTGLNPWDGDKIFAYSITREDGETLVLRNDGDLKSQKVFWKTLKDLWADPSIIKVIHNWKFELHFLLRHNIYIHPDTTVHDTMIMSQILNNLEPSHKLEYLADVYCPDKSITRYWKAIDKIVKHQFTQRGNYQRIDKSTMYKYQENDGIRCLLLYNLYWDKIKNDTFNLKSYNIEMALIRPTQKMEKKGIVLSRANTFKLIKTLHTEIDTIQDEAFSLYKKFINFNSDDEIRVLLYNDFGIPETKFTKKAGKPTTDKDFLLELRHQRKDLQPHIDLIIKYRSYSKGISMTQGYLDHAKANNVINHDVLTNPTKTGRQASRNPNLQNVSKKASLKNLFPVPARMCFVPHENCWIYFVDYSGIELRLIIDATQCIKLMKVIEKNEDVHAVAASYWFGELWTNWAKCLEVFLPTRKKLFKQYKLDLRSNSYKGERKSIDEIYQIYFGLCKGLLRGATKNCTFGIAYGGGLEKLASTVDMNIELLEPGYHAYKAEFPEIANFTPNTIREIKSLGYTTTAFGRKLFVDKTKLFAGSNARIQGTAAQILKVGTAHVDTYVEPITNLNLLLPIHDELVMSVHDDIAEEYSIFNDISHHLTNIPEIKVPLDVEWKRTKTNWNETEDFKIGV